MPKITQLTVAQYLSDLANDIRAKKPIEEALLDLEDALDSWRNIWPDESKEDDDYYDDKDDDEDEIV